MKTEIKQQVTNENNITVNIDQNPMKQLYIDVKPATNFKSNVSVQQSSSLFNLTTLAQTELQGPVNTMYK